MKKTISLFVLLFSSVLFAQGILDYFPVSKGSVWEYVSDNGTVVETDLMYSSKETDNGYLCYLFLEQRPLGITSTLYGLKDNKIVILAAKNVLGKIREYEEPYPLVLGKEKLKYEFNDGDLNKCTTKKASISFDDKKYDDCILVIQDSYYDRDKKMTTKSYYARDVGLVYVTLINNDGKETVYKKLRQYSISK